MPSVSDERYPHIINAVLARPWAIDQTSLAWGAMMEVLAMRAAGQVFSEAELMERLGATRNGPRAGGPRQKNVAVIPIYGVINPRGNMMARSSGGTSAASIADEFRAAMGDPDIDGIVFDVDSPGGVVEGVEELAAEIQDARGQKPMAAVANHLAASAAYWAIAGVDEIAVTPSGQVGSIGIFAAHDDLTAAMEKAGVKRTVISAGKYKAEGALGRALSEEAVAAAQEQVDAFYKMFVDRVAKGRGVGVEAVRSGFGEGRVVLAKKALEAGMVDRIDSLENVIRRVARGAVGTPGMKALDSSTVWGIEGMAAAATFTDHLDAVAALVETTTAEARKRKAVRAADGRTLSEGTRAGLTRLAEELKDLADVPEPDAEDEDEEVPTPARKASLELYELAAAGGYDI